MQKANMQPSKGNSFKDNLEAFFYIVVFASIIVGLVLWFFKILFSPIKFLLMSNAALAEQERVEAGEKSYNRITRIKNFEYDKTDPMNQYLERYISHPEKYTNEVSENERYKAWHDAWADGIFDSELRWAPEMYTKESINPVFLNYLEMQIKLHEGSWFRTYKLLSTIRGFYPEFTPSVSGALQDIEALRARVQIKKLRTEIFAEMRESNIYGGLTEALLARNLPKEEMQRRVVVLKRCAELNYLDELSDYLADKHIDPDSDEANKLDDFCLNKNSWAVYRDHNRITACLKDLSEEQVEELMDYADETRLVTDIQEDIEELVNNKFKELMKNTKRAHGNKNLKWEA